MSPWTHLPALTRDRITGRSSIKVGHHTHPGPPRGYTILLCGGAGGVDATGSASIHPRIRVSRLPLTWSRRCNRSCALAEAPVDASAIPARCPSLTAQTRARAEGRCPPDQSSRYSDGLGVGNLITRTNAEVNVGVGGACNCGQVGRRPPCRGAPDSRWREAEKGKGVQDAMAAIMDRHRVVSPPETDTTIGALPLPNYSAGSGRVRSPLWLLTASREASIPTTRCRTAVCSFRCPRPRPHRFVPMSLRSARPHYRCDARRSANGEGPRPVSHPAG